MKETLQAAYQPIVDIQSGHGTVAHYEALARIRNDATGNGHSALIQVAERFEFIHRLDLAMVELVLKDMECGVDTIALNVSPFTIEHAIDELFRLLVKHRHLVGRLIVEITESLPVHDVKRIRYFMDVVRKYGGRIALDDFGNGKGCFTEDLVRVLQPDYLKLDGAVLERALFFGDVRELAIACELAKSFGGEMIAEFVDSPQKIAYLRAAGVRYAQGAAFGMPALREAAAVTPPVRPYINGNGTMLAGR